MTAFLIASLLFLQVSVQPAPAAMVLDVQGRVELEPAKGMAKALAVMDLLYPGDRLRPDAGGHDSRRLHSQR